MAVKLTSPVFDTAVPAGHPLLWTRNFDQETTALPNTLRLHLRGFRPALSIVAMLVAVACLQGTMASTRLSPRSGQAIGDGQRKGVSGAGASRSKALEPTDPQPPDTATIEDPPAGPDRGEPAGRLLATTTTLLEEREPNDTAATANALGGSSVRARGYIVPSGDADVFSFDGTAGDRVYVATMTLFSTESSDTVLELLAPDGTTVIEVDNDEGTYGANSSSIAGTPLAQTGTHFVRVRHVSDSAEIRPYDLFFRLQTVAPTPETEPNHTIPGQMTAASGHMSGTCSPVDVDLFAFSLNAGDTIFASVDADPERDTVTWNPRLGIGTFFATTFVNSGGGATSPNSEANFMTVQQAGTFRVRVDSEAGSGTYNLSITIYPRNNRGTCTTYASTNVPMAISSGAPPIVVDSTLTVPGNPRIDHLRVNIELDHTFVPDLDAELIAPDGSSIILFTDIGRPISGPAFMDMTLDDDAAIPCSTLNIHFDAAFQPEASSRLGWRHGSLAGGTWTLRIRDDATGDGGMLDSWSLEICEFDEPVCNEGSNVIYTTNFEADDGGFTHSGTLDEWERGLPSFAPVTGANSGTNAWKTDLDGTYESSSSQDLFSPNIVLPVSQAIRLQWAQKYQLEDATFDHASVTVREVGNPANSRVVWQHSEDTMTETVGSPATVINEVAGWNRVRADITDFAGLTVEVVFHLDSDSTVNLAGYAIDDVLVEACLACFVTCPSDVTVPNDANQCGAVVNYPPPTGSMECGPISCSPPAGSFFPVGTTTVTCTENPDRSPEGGPLPSCSFSVTVEDTQAPTLACPANVIQSNDPGQCSAVVNYTAPSAADNCPGVGVPVCVPASGSTFPVGTTTVNCTVADASANSPDGTCSFTVTVNDTQPPSIVCPANVTQANDANQCGAVMSFATPAGADNCPGQTVACTPASGSFFPVGTTTTVCVATDASGNTATCSFTVTVQDTQAPTITCPGDITTTGNDTSNCSLTGAVTYPAPTVTDNCPGAVTVCVPPSGSTFPEGTTTVTCTASDASPNSPDSVCTFTVTVTSVGAFDVCVFDDSSNDSWSIVTDTASPIYGFWRYRVAATGELFCGTASRLSYVPNRSLTASDTDDPRVFTNANISWGTRAGTVKLVDRATGRQFVLRDRNILDSVCQ